MDTAKQAGRILEAWNGWDCRRFQAELQSALVFCQTKMPASELDGEQQAVLQSVVQRFRQVSQKSEQIHASQEFEAGLLLLRHLHRRAA